MRVRSLRAEMPLTPKGYCDSRNRGSRFFMITPRAEMPLTPKGYCDTPANPVLYDAAECHGRNAPNAERLL